MKGLQGFAIAAALGIVGAVCSWLYLAQLGKNLEKVSFVVVKPGAQINVGDHFKSEHFAPVAIPREHLGNLDQVGIQWKDLPTVIGKPATVSYRGGELLFEQDLRTPPHKSLSELIGENEVARWVPVNAREFVSSSVNPGDKVSFEVARLPGGSPVRAGTGQSGGAATTEIIGPFRILQLGERMGERNVQKAAGRSMGSEHVIAIGVRYENGQMEPKAERLFQALRLGGNQGAQVIVHSSRTEK